MYLGWPVTAANADYENANRRFLFAMSNRTSYKFIIEETRKECGTLNVPYRELDAGTNEKPAEICISGYKRNLALYGVTYTLQFRISETTGKDRNYKLHVFLGIGLTTDNYFGWCITIGEERKLSPEIRRKRQDSKDGFNRNKRNAQDRVLNHGGMRRLRASFDQLKLDIEMLTDNESYSRPYMIIRSMAPTESSNELLIEPTHRFS
jgi:hypothetical protein